MDRAHSPDKGLRPLLRRSATASPDVSPPSRLDHKDRETITSRVSGLPSQAAKRLHLHTRGPSKDLQGRVSRQDQGEASASGHSHSHLRAAQLPAHAVKQLAKGATHKVQHSAKTAHRPAALHRHHSSVDDQDGSAGEEADVSLSVHFEAVALERRRREARDEEVEASLRELTDLATRMTRQLDTTYYAILEKAEQLRTTVDQLSELNTQSVELNDRFEKDTKDLESRIRGEVDEFKDFKKQEKQVHRLEERMRKSMDRAEALSGRLEEARKRVVKWQEREAEWQAKTSARLRASAITTGCVVGAVLLLLLVRWIWLTRRKEDSLEALANETKYGLDLWELRHNFGLPFRKTIPRLKEQALGDDKRLRLLDQL